MAEHFHYSETYMSRHIRQMTGETYTAMVRKYRLQKAAELLETTSLKLNDICYEIGYSDPAQFIRNFKEQYAMTPGKYRKAAMEKR